MSSPRIERYSEKSIVVYGNTKPFKEALKGIGGRYNPNLKDGCGWVFQSKSVGEVEKILGIKLKEDGNDVSNEHLSGENKMIVGLVVDLLLSLNQTSSFMYQYVNTSDYKKAMVSQLTRHFNDSENHTEVETVDKIRSLIPLSSEIIEENLKLHASEFFTCKRAKIV